MTHRGGPERGPVRGHPCRLAGGGSPGGRAPVLPTPQTPPGPSPRQHTQKRAPSYVGRTVRLDGRMFGGSNGRAYPPNPLPDAGRGRQLGARTKGRGLSDRSTRSGQGCRPTRSATVSAGNTDALADSSSSDSRWVKTATTHPSPTAAGEGQGEGASQVRTTREVLTNETPPSRVGKGVGGLGRIVPFRGLRGLEGPRGPRTDSFPAKFQSPSGV